MKAIGLLSLLLLCSCTVTNPRATFEAGYIDLDLGWRSKHTIRGIDAIQTTARVEAEFWRSKHFAFDIGAGPTIVFPTDRSGEAYGGEVMGRFRWKATNWLEPYIMASKGVTYHEHSWRPTRVKYGFTTQQIVGTRLKASEQVWFHLDWRFWHNSWGKSKLGSDFRSLFNLKNKGDNPGFEGGAIFAAVSVAW